MQNLRPAIVAILLATSPLAALPNSASAQSCTCAGAGIHAEAAPPPLPTYDQPPIPAPGYLWTPGYWSWNNEDYYWVPGTWVEPPRPGVLWTPGYWGFADGVYTFNPGYWGPHVGFYGGVAYGFGYGGSGYQGGRWDNGEFFYNRSVNNVGRTHIANVYNETVVVDNASANRASFNGGAGGIIAKPTAEEEAAAKEPHEKPTNLQVEHRRAASISAGSFAEKNHGKPTVAATARPGVLTGPSIVRARAVGEPATLTPASDETPKGDAAPSKEQTKTPEKRDLNKEPKTETEPSGEKPRTEGTPIEKTPAAKESKRPEKLDRANEPKTEAKPSIEKAPAEKTPVDKTMIEKAPAPKEPMAKAPEAKEPPRGPRPATDKPECGRPGEPPCR
jgi:WXXGXW repeat (2 copies)